MTLDKSQHIKVNIEIIILHLDSHSYDVKFYFIFKFNDMEKRKLKKTLLL